MSQPEINAEQFVDAEAVRGRSGDRKALREEGARFYQRVLEKKRYDPIVLWLEPLSFSSVMLFSMYLSKASFSIDFIKI